VIQTWALFIDAYRELSAKKLFWVTLVLSGLVVVAFGIVGINDKGLTLLWWEFPLPLLNSKTIAPAMFYKFVFAEFGVPVWLAWVAGVLALISTASIIPDFIAGGAVELTLSKPIGRARLFLTKFLTGLLFVTLQVGLFTGACFLVIGIRGGSWEWGLWLAVPIVLLMFSYLFSVSVLVGLLTRSTIAALLLTLLFWFVVWLVNATDAVMIMQRESAVLTLETAERTLAKREENVRNMISKQPTENSSQTPTPDADTVAQHPLVVYARGQAQEARDSVDTWKQWATLVYRIKTVFPKTSETIALLDRSLLSIEDRRLLRPQSVEPDEDVAESEPPRRRRGPARGIEERVEKAVRARSVGWVVGTSVAFELLMLSIATVVFVRRDF
jgi:ABC-type transport system involved in multi-copper enzyme maturation permease subunit